MNEFVSIKEAAAELGWSVEELESQLLHDGLLLEIDGELVASPHPTIQRMEPVAPEPTPAELEDYATGLIPEDAEILETFGEDGVTTVSADGSVIAVHGHGRGPLTNEALSTGGWYAVALEEINGVRLEIYHRAPVASPLGS